MVGGASAGDVNGDGWPDLYLPRWNDGDWLLINNK